MIWCVATPSEVVVNVHVPPLNAHAPPLSDAPPSRNVTVPVGFAPTTVAVTVTASPEFDGEGALVSVVVVVAGG